MKRKSVMGMVLLMLLLCVAGCGREKDSVTSEKEKVQVQKEKEEGRQQLKLGMTLYSLQNEYIIRFANAAAEYADEKGIELNIYDGNYDAELQISQVEEMLAEGVDGIILIPQDASKCTECVDSAIQEKVPIIAVNTRVDHEGITSYVGSDDVKAGEMILQQTAEALQGQGNVVILEGPMGQSAQIERMQGIKNILGQYPDIHVIGRKTANWSRVEAKLVVSGWLQTFEKVDAVIAENDDMALGALDAIEDAGQAPGEEIFVVGVDGLEEALEEVSKGSMLMTVYQDAEEQAAAAMDTLLKSISGEKVEKEYMVPFDQVTRENAEEYERKIEKNEIE